MFIVIELIEAMDEGPLGVLYEGPANGWAIELLGRMSSPPVPPLAEEGVVGEAVAMGERTASPFSPKLHIHREREGHAAKNNDRIQLPSQLQVRKGYWCPSHR